MHPAIENLKSNQRQLDMDGCEVGVSRQALEEALDITSELYGALVMVRDADNDCEKDDLPTIPPVARSRIDAAITKAEGGSA